MIKYIKGCVWFARRYGLRTLWRYEKDRRAGMTLNYAEIFSANELAILEEHGLSMWGKRID